MLLAAVLFSGLNATIRHLTATLDLHPFQGAFFRSLFGLLFMLPLLARRGLVSLRTRRTPLYLVRAAFGVVGLLGQFVSIALLPFATAIALSFTAPFFTTALAFWLLHEQVRLRRWTAIAAGFVGVLIILRPGLQPLEIGVIAALCAALASAINTIVVKVLARTEPPDAIVIYMTVYLTPLTLVPALFVWEWPPLSMLPWLCLMGAFGSLGHMAMTRSYRAADASYVLSFDFTRLPFAAFIGFVVFAEVPDVWTFTGAAVIGLSGLYIAHREAKVSRLKPASLTPAAEAHGPPPRPGGG